MACECDSDLTLFEIATRGFTEVMFGHERNNTLSGELVL